MMKKAGYDPEFSVGLTICSACQGVIIPPSHNMIIYAFAVGTASQLAGGQLVVVSVGKLFLGDMLRNTDGHHNADHRPHYFD